MPRKMLINALHPEEARVAIVEEGRLVDLDIEIAGSEQTRGNIYKGVVLRAEPALQAAFIDIGLKKPGFLQLGELHPDWWQWRDDVPEEQRKRRPRIQDVLRRGQELIVQVEKDERDMKGAALTTYLSLPGRYMVVMPGSDSSGVSRKVEAEGERKKLKEMVKEMNVPAGVGTIIRTEAMGKTVEELQKDLDSLIARFDEIRQLGKKSKAPALIHKEYPVVIRMIRDYFSADIDEVLVDSKEVYKEARAFFKETMPAYEKRVKMHTENRPIFSRFQIEEQIDQIYEKKVPLKSGGSLVIEPTEALVSIDVNSGKSTGEKGVEDTAFRTNLEAAEEAARQLRLRDLGGLIVIDFIDMRDSKRIREVEKTLKDALKADKARVTVGRISQFGMLEMSRQRIKQTLEQGSVLDCPHCSGRGKVKSVESMAISFLRKVHGAAAKGTAAEVRGELPLEVAYYLLNRKKRELTQIENDYEIEVTIKGKPSFLMNQLGLETVKRERPAHIESHADEQMPGPAKPARKAAPAAPVPAATVEEGVDEAKGKKKRKSRSKKGQEEAAAVEAAVPETAAAEVEALPEAVAVEAPAEEAGGEEHGEERRKKRRRRRRRGKGKHEGGAEQPEPAEHGEPLPEGGAEPAAAAPESETHAGEGQPEEHRKKRRRKRKRGAKPAAEGEVAVATVAVEGAVPVAPVVPEQPAAAAKPKRPSRARKAPAAEASVPAAEPVAAAASAPEPEAKAPARRTRKAKAAPAAASQPVEAVTAPPAPVEAPKPAAKKPKKAAAPKKAAPAAVAEPAAKPKRAPRRKKGEPPAGEE